MRSWVLSALLLLGASVQAAEPHGELCLDSTFVQLWQQHLGWPAARWESLFDAFERLGVREVVVQWSEVDDLRFFEARARSAAGPVDAILSQAERRGMQVVMGLSHDTRYWERVAKPGRASYLAERRLRNELLIAALAPRLAGAKAVRGWYISEEVDDLNWTAPQDAAALGSYLQGLSERLAANGLARGVAVSGFANARTAPDGLAQQWESRLQAAPGLKQLYFQDGIGVGKLQLGRLPAHYDSLARTMRQHGGVLVPVVETFVQVAGPPLDGAAFAARPAPLSRLEQQVRAARRMGKVASFGVPEYLSPEGGEAAAQAYGQWLALLDSRHERCSGSSATK